MQKGYEVEDALKTVCDPKSLGTTQLLSAAGTCLLIAKTAILKRWAEHFDSVPNRPSSNNDEVINRLLHITKTNLYNFDPLNPTFI